MGVCVWPKCSSINSSTTINEEQCQSFTLESTISIYRLKQSEFLRSFPHQY